MAKSILEQSKTVTTTQSQRSETLVIVLPTNEMTDKVTRQYCELDLMGEWFADDTTDEESLGTCYH